MQETRIEAVLRRESCIVIGGLSAITVLSWVYLFAGTGTGMSLWDMSRIALSPGIAPSGSGMAISMGSGTMPDHWRAAYWVLMVLMWWIMMIAMMVPSAAPTILLYARVHRHEQEKRSLAPGFVPTSLFVTGYLAAWLGFSVLATVLQYTLEQMGLMSGMMMWSLNPWLSAAVLAGAGVYQFTPLKQSCLKQCRRPGAYLAGHWRPHGWGAFVMGCNHGTICVTCCWALMALLFVGGIMNLLWMAGLTVFVLIEKVVPRGDLVARVTGVACLTAAWFVIATTVS